VEGGPLLTEEFKEFTKGVVPFLHITTHIEGRKDEDLFGTLGGRGFPTFFFLDAKGDVVAQHDGPRSAEGFAATKEKAQEFIDLRNKAAAGDKAAKFKYTLARAGMGKLTVAELQKEIKGLGKLSDADQATYRSALAELMVDEIQQTAVGERYAAMLKDGLVPSDAQKQVQFYWTIFGYAEYSKDVTLAGKALAGLKTAAAGEARYARALDNADQRYAKMKEAK